MQREPLHLPRLISLLLVLATSICVIGTCAWQLQNLHDKRERARRTFPGGRLHVTDNIVTTALSAVVGALSGLAALAFLLNLLRRRRADTVKRGISTMAQVATLAGLALATLAVAIASTVIVATKAARITAPGIPASTIARAVVAAGLKLAYRKHGHNQSYVICDWLLWLALTIATVVTLLARRRPAQRIDGDSGPGIVADKDPRYSGGSVADRKAIV